VYHGTGAIAFFQRNCAKFTHGFLLDRVGLDWMVSGASFGAGLAASSLLLGWIHCVHAALVRVVNIVGIAAYLGIFRCGCCMRCDRPATSSWFALDPRLNEEIHGLGTACRTTMRSP